MEDHSFYPALFNHPDKNIVAAATKYVDEVKGLKESFENYMSKWNSPEIVQNNPDDFINETMDLFEAISNRIYKEDNVLYPLVENI
jgi:hemerythrin-like domain-containing protein